MQQLKGRALMGCCSTPTQFLKLLGPRTATTKIFMENLCCSSMERRSRIGAGRKHGNGTAVTIERSASFSKERSETGEAGFGQPANFRHVFKDAN